MAVHKTVKHTTISVLALLVLLVGGGVAYTFYVGQKGPQNALATANEPKVPAEPVLKPSVPSADAVESAAVEFITSPVAPGANASITIKTNATSTCTIAVNYNGVASKDSGLTPRVADDFGNVSWSWTVDPAAPLGKWPVKVTCTYHERSAVVQADLVVARQ